MYLGYRKSIVLNHNPFMTFNQDPTTNDPVSVIVYLLDF